MTWGLQLDNTFQHVILDGLIWITMASVTNITQQTRPGQRHLSHADHPVHPQHLHLFMIKQQMTSSQLCLEDHSGVGLEAIKMTRRTGTGQMEASGLGTTTGGQDSLTMLVEMRIILVSISVDQESGMTSMRIFHHSINPSIKDQSVSMTHSKVSDGS